MLFWQLLLFAALCSEATGCMPRCHTFPWLRGGGFRCLFSISAGGNNPPLCLLLQKWQRRFFILYEHGLLRYALDEMVSAALQTRGKPANPSLVAVALPMHGTGTSLSSPGALWPSPGIAGRWGKLVFGVNQQWERAAGRSGAGGGSSGSACCPQGAPRLLPVPFLGARWGLVVENHLGCVWEGDSDARGK